MWSYYYYYFDRFFFLLQNAGTHSFSIGVTEVLNTNLLIELSADDVEYVYQRLISLSSIFFFSSILFEILSVIYSSLYLVYFIHFIIFYFILFGFSFFRSPGKILSINIPTFEALSQFGVATIKTKNTGEVEASYGLTVFLLIFRFSFRILFWKMIVSLFLNLSFFNLFKCLSIFRLFCTSELLNC